MVAVVFEVAAAELEDADPPEPHAERATSAVSDSQLERRGRRVMVTVCARPLGGRCEHAGAPLSRSAQLDALVVCGVGAGVAGTAAIGVVALGAALVVAARATVVDGTEVVTVDGTVTTVTPAGRHNWSPGCSGVDDVAPLSCNSVARSSEVASARRSQ